jgi:hypothetical protein
MQRSCAIVGTRADVRGPAQARPLRASYGRDGSQTQINKPGQLESIGANRSQFDLIQPMNIVLDYDYDYD